jgi:hypothetical protein
MYDMTAVSSSCTSAWRLGRLARPACTGRDCIWGHVDQRRTYCREGGRVKPIEAYPAHRDCVAGKCQRRAEKQQVAMFYARTFAAMLHRSIFRKALCAPTQKSRVFLRQRCHVPSQVHQRLGPLLRGVR